jgi:flagella basal body P-ring formation protein FlgA
MLERHYTVNRFSHFTAFTLPWPGLFTLLGVAFLMQQASPVQAEQWITGAQIATLAEPSLNAYAQAYCDEKNLNPCTKSLRLNVPETRTFRVNALAAHEPFSVHVQIENTLQPFEQGYGVARVSLNSTQTPYSHTLQLPVSGVEHVAVWRVKSPIAANEAVAPHVSQELRWLDAREKRNAFTEATLPPSARSRQPLQEGDIVTTQVLSVPPLVKAWQPVRILVRLVRSGKPMQLAMEGEAMQNGGLGQKIAVRQMGFEKKRFTGTVVAPGLVQVDL